MPDAWSLAGQYIEACNCDVACPCIFGSDPTPGVCTYLGGFHIEKGSMGVLRLDELNFAFAIFSPGKMSLGNWEAAYYVDQRATESQRRALETILTGKAGGVFSAWASAFGNFYGVSSVPIEFLADGKKRSLVVSGIAEMHIQAIDRGWGQDTTISPGTFGPEFTVAKSEKLSMSDHGWKWDISGKNGFYSPFSVSGP
jgi:hypothetical protein